MARIRTFKPELLKHEELFDLERETGFPMRIAWAGMFTACDREGRFKWRPRQLKADILPYDDLDFSMVLDAFWKHGFIVKYRVDSEDYGYIPTWHKHQVINNRENDSVLPAPEQTFCLQPVDACVTRASRVVHVMSTRSQSGKAEGKGKEGKGKEENTCVESSKTDDSPPPIAGTLPLNDGSEHPVSKQDEEQWRKLYPAVDVRQELRSMKGWLIANPTRRKTRSGINKFINNWLAKEQNRARVEHGTNQPGRTTSLGKQAERNDANKDAILAGIFGGNASGNAAYGCVSGTNDVDTSRSCDVDTPSPRLLPGSH